jgi:hypothetical protein
MDPPTSSDIEVYRDCMSEVWEQINLVQTALAGRVYMEQKTIALHFRQVLESFAYALLAANRKEYAASHQNWRNQRAKEIFKNIKELNPGCYPIPLLAPREIAPGRMHFDQVPRGFLNWDQFLDLFAQTSGEIHKPNPYSVKKKEKFQSPKAWVDRIQTLLRLHAVTLLDGSCWVVTIYNTGEVTVQPCEPIQSGFESHVGPGDAADPLKEP